MKKIPSKSIDMILCDLPYQMTGQKWDIIIPFNLLWEQYERIIKDNGIILLTSIQPFSSALVMSNPKLFKYEWVWEKDQGRNFQLAKKQPLKITESILVFYKKPPLYNPQGLIKLEKPIIKSNKGKGGKLGHLSSEEKRKEYIQEYSNYPKNLIKFNSDRGLHPTQKPVALFEYLIKTYSKEGQIILDNCAGSGTTAIACINTNRNYILIEKEKEYIDIINKRIAGHTGA
jgi:site-specific DNA-methyltransferase (adenine-specific)